MIRKYVCFVGCSFVTIYQHEKHGLVVVFQDNKIEIDRVMLINDADGKDIEGAEFEEVQKIIIESIPMFHRELV